MNLLEAEGICKKFPAFSLNNVSLSVAQGCIVGLMGRNGAGKSTLLRIIAGLAAADSGTVRICGRKQNESDREQLGIVFGGTEIYPYKPIGMIAGVYARFCRMWDAAAYRRFIDDFSLDERKRFRELSNGMKVKFLLALACSHRAKLLVLDEPTSGLDPVARAEILTMIRDHASRDGCGVLFSTQIVSDLEQCADSIVYLRGGSVVRNAPKSEYLSNCTNLHGTMSGLEGYFLYEEGVVKEPDI